MYLNGVQAVQMPVEHNDDWYALYEEHLHFPYGHTLPMPSDLSQLYQQVHAPSVDNTPSLPSQPQQYEYNGSGSREADEPDPSSRPRLTTEQTNILEAKFQQDPKPLTNTKKDLAQKIGLTLDKVNNWYQNRRAKAKNAKKNNIETFNVLHVGEHQSAWPYPDFQAAAFPNPLLHPPQVISTSLNVPLEIHHPSAAQTTVGSSGAFQGPVKFEEVHQASVLHESLPQVPAVGSEGSMNGPMSTEEQVLKTYEVMALRYPSFWNSQDTSHEKQRSDFEALNLIHELDKDAESGNGIKLQSDSRRSRFTGPEMYQPSPVSAPWNDHQQTPLMAWESAEQNDSIFGADQMLLQQSALVGLSQPTTGQQSSGNMVQCSTSIDQFTAMMIQEEALHRSSSPSPLISSPAEISSRKFSSRRGSSSSELANNFDTIRLQKAPSQQSSDEEVFKTPKIPQMSIAARRKKRPVALGPLSTRSFSCTSPPNSSSGSKTVTAGLPLSVRRIKSTGNSLNVIGGRIQKSGVSSAQRSPLNLSTFQEADALNHINGFATSSPSCSQATSTNGQVPITPHTPLASERLPVEWNKSLTHSTSIPNMVHYQHHPFSPPQEYGASPPATPYLQLPAYMQYNQQHMVAPPQSAPAHLASFPHMSPPYQAMPGTPSGYFPPHVVSPESYQYQPGPQIMPAQSLPVYDYQPQQCAWGYEQPQIINCSPPLGGHPAFYALHAPQPQKELEVVMAEFPKPSDANSPPKEPYRPKQYTFQNLGPDDY
ncbi:hypothetical protein MMC13_004592 [Lambiella insularis]|nr:hypothetical protein [Lambiella insularis]